MSSVVWTTSTLEISKRRKSQTQSTMFHVTLADVPHVRVSINLPQENNKLPADLGGT